MQQNAQQASPLAPTLASIAVLIPAWQPEPALIALARELATAGFSRIFIIDDGSDAAHEPVFNSLRANGHQVLRHAVNLGKGTALKTGFNALLLEESALIGVVTADADGQHTPADIARVATALLAEPSRPVLGVRSFDHNVPLRSKFGNSLTRLIFGFVTGVRVRDTQTGLRGIPLALLPSLLVLAGERYEYEMTMLASLCRDGHKPVEVPIETVYIDGNRGSHFDPVWDSMRIYFVLARFCLSSVLAASLDFCGFAVTFALTHNIATSVAVGRLSSLVNFALNKRFVFHSDASVTRTIWRYYLLAAAIAALSYGLITALTRHAHCNVFAAKIAVDILLSLVSFSAQRTFVFRRGRRL